ncbi:MAG: DUF655 domain-containing protein [Thermoplasmata archaeon]|nr:DUF655 domain-containing protein [Thermoplasmata archaeon]
MDFLPAGRSTEHGFQRGPIALALGPSELKLLEIVARPGAQLAPGARIALVAAPGEPAPSIDHVRRRIGYDELSTTARDALGDALAAAVLEEPARYLKFVNESPSVSRKFHLLELLPGIGKKTMLAIVEERRRAPFASFREMEDRLHLKSPERLIAARIEQEMRGVEDKYRLFVPA